MYPVSSVNHLPGTHNTRIPDNPVYLAYQDLILKITSDFPRPRPKHDRRRGLLIHDFSGDDIAFFENLYCASQRMASDPNGLFNRYPALKTHSFGENEYDVLLFCVDPYDRMKEVRSIVLTAPIGHGKTTLLWYVLGYLRSIIPEIQERLFPIIFDLNNHRNELVAENEKGLAFLLAHFREKLLYPKLKAITWTYCKTNNERFWAWYKEIADSELASDEEELLESTTDEKSALPAIYDRRKEEKQQPEFIFLVCRYLHEEHGKQVSVIFDNADVLPIDIQLAFLFEIKNIEQLGDFRCVITLRDISYEKLDALAIGTLPNRRIRWRDRDSLEITASRVSYFLETMIPAYGSNPIKLDGKHVHVERVKKLISNALDLSSSPEISNMLGLLSLGDIRRQQILLRILLSSGYIPEKSTRSTVTAAMVDSNIEEKLPLPVALAAILTDNHSTFFSKISKRVPGVINVFACPGLSSPWKIVLRAMILQHLYRHDGGGFEDRESLLGHFDELFPSKHQREKIREGVLTSLVRLLSEGLIRSPDVYEVASIAELREKVDEIGITILGQYYVDELMFNPDYLIYIKDDVDFDVDLGLIGCHGVRADCTNGRSGEINASKQIALNTEEAVRAFAQFGYQEISLRNELAKRKCLVPFEHEFVPSSRLFALGALSALHSFSRDILKNPRIQTRAIAKIKELGSIMG